MQSTSHKHITIVLLTTAFIAVTGVIVLSAALLLQLNPDTSLLTVYVGIVSSAATGMIAILANLRTQKGDEATDVNVINSKTDPVPTTTEKP